jgi:phosphate:Na+ symporter
VILTLTAVAQIAAETDSIKWTALVFGLLGGLAIFLIGMEMMTEALRLVVGGKARRVIELLT